MSRNQFSHSVVSNSLRPHEPQHVRPPCPSPTLRVHPNPRPLNRWCHPTISSSVIPFSSYPQSFPASWSFQSQLFASGGQSIGATASKSVLPRNTQDWLPSGWTGWIYLQSKGRSRVFSNTTVKKCQFFGAQLYSPAVTSIHDHCQRIGRIKKFFDYFVLISRVGGSLVAKLCLTLETPWNCSPPGSSVHGIFQTRILECVAISSCRGSSQPRDWTWISCIAGRFFTDWATREVY